MANVEIQYVRAPFPSDAKIEETRESIFDMIVKAQMTALQEGIEANTIVINKDMVKVSEFWFGEGRTARCVPAMICGLNVYFTKGDLPPNYSFAVLKGPENRLAQFEAIGMEPDELRKAAELYRKIKEELE